MRMKSIMKRKLSSKMRIIQTKDIQTEVIRRAITTMVVVPMLKCNQTFQLILIVETNT